MSGVTIVPGAKSTDLAHDVAKWLIRDMLKDGGATNFIDGNNASKDAVAGKMHLFAGYAEDLPDDAAIVSTSDDGQDDGEFPPIRKATVNILVRAADDASNSGPDKASAAAQAIKEFLRDTNSEAKTMQSFPDLHVRILGVFNPRILPGGRDQVGRSQFLVEFKVRYMDFISQSS